MVDKEMLLKLLIEDLESKTKEELLAELDEYGVEYELQEEKS